MPVSLPDQDKPPHVTELGLPAEPGWGKSTSTAILSHLTLPRPRQSSRSRRIRVIRALRCCWQMYRVGIWMTANPTETYS